MSWVRDGMHFLICEFCGRLVIYIHCFCHRLRLVVIAVSWEVSKKLASVKKIIKVIVKKD